MGNSQEQKSVIATSDRDITTLTRQQSAGGLYTRFLNFFAPCVVLDSDGPR